jgi:hypothetical protein
MCHLPGTSPHELAGLVERLGYGALALDVSRAHQLHAARQDAEPGDRLTLLGQIAPPPPLHLPLRPEATRVWLGRCLAAAEARGCTMLGGPLAGLPGQMDDDPASAFALTCEVLADAAAEAGARGITLCLQPRNRYESSWLCTPTDGFALVEAVASPALRLQLNSFHLRVEGADTAAALAPTRNMLAAVVVVAPVLPAVESGLGAAQPDEPDGAGERLQPLWQALASLSFKGALIFTPESVRQSPWAATSVARPVDVERTAAVGLRLLQDGVRQMNGATRRTTSQAAARASATMEEPPVTSAPARTPARRSAAPAAASKRKPASGKSYRR